MKSVLFVIGLCGFLFVSASDDQNRKNNVQDNQTNMTQRCRPHNKHKYSGDSLLKKNDKDIKPLIKSCPISFVCLILCGIKDDGNAHQKINYEEEITFIDVEK